MADLDKETAEEAYKAFGEEDSSLDAWEAEAGNDDLVEKEPTGQDVDTELDGGKTKKEPPMISGNSGMVDLINGKLTREQAKELTCPEYDSFDDVVDGNGIRAERLAEYTSVIPFWYKSYKDGKEKMGTIPKYPQFADLFGVKDTASISMGDVLRKFAPEHYDSVMSADRESDLLAKCAGEIIARRGLDFSRKLDEDDYAVLERNGVKDPRKYGTVSDITGIGAAVMEVDPDEHCVYNADYAEAVSGMFGGPEDGSEVEVVSLDEVLGCLDPKVLKGLVGKDRNDIVEVEADYGDDNADEDTTFVPFDMDRKPGSIFRAMRDSGTQPDTEVKKW